ncbi:MAG: TIR domain-containing protein [Alphaproteobacteria bacterium]|nr:TIR domain-containing protein [Alphaproteobacteria bacterium]
MDLREAIRTNPDHKGSVGQIVEKGHLQGMLAEKDALIGAHFHYETSTAILSVEDPKLIFFLRNIGWRNFAKRVGYTTDYFKGQHDIALSFAGANRDIASKFFDFLMEREVTVFYDENEQHRIVSVSVEDYLAPIYKTEAQFVVALLSPEYPTRIWTKFESDIFRQRFGEGAVIPVKFSNLVPGFF